MLSIHRRQKCDFLCIIQILHYAEDTQDSAWGRKHEGNEHYSTFSGATVLAGVMDICPYFLIFNIITRGEYWVVVATKKRGIMTICWASLSRSHNIHSKLKKNPREKPSVAAPPRVFHSDFSLVFREYLWIRFADLCILSHWYFAGRC